MILIANFTFGWRNILLGILYQALVPPQGEADACKIYLRAIPNEMSRAYHCTVH